VPPARLILATRNADKLRELADLLGGLGVEFVSLADYPEVPEVAETGATYLDNARAKALAVARACGTAALGDDSGIEVDALGGRPGLHSARYSGGRSADNLALLLHQLEGVPTEQRTARFRCALVVALPDGRTLTAEGTCEGVIAGAPRGSHGFGYDPVFVDPASGQTFGEMDPARKHALSHRARACGALRPHLADFLRQQ
jgi:XTP/dITP diphosphohydrolase